MTYYRKHCRKKTLSSDEEAEVNLEYNLRSRKVRKLTEDDTNIKDGDEDKRGNQLLLTITSDYHYCSNQ